MTEPRRRIIGPIELLAFLLLIGLLAVAAWRLIDRQAFPILGACEMPGDGRPLIVLVTEQAGRLVAECIRIKPADRQLQQRPA